MAANSDEARGWLQRWLPQLVLSPSFAVVILFVYGFIAWTAYISVSSSRMLPNYKFVGMTQYTKLWKTLNWQVALDNLLIFGSLYLCLIHI